MVVRAKPIFWKSWSDTSRIFFLVASFLVSRRPIVPLERGLQEREDHPSRDGSQESHELPGAQEPEESGAHQEEAQDAQPGRKETDPESDRAQAPSKITHRPFLRPAAIYL